MLRGSQNQVVGGGRRAFQKALHGHPILGPSSRRSKLEICDDFTTQLRVSSPSRSPSQPQEEGINLLWVLLVLRPPSARHCPCVSFPSSSGASGAPRLRAPHRTRPQLSTSRSGLSHSQGQRAHQTTVRTAHETMGVAHKNTGYRTLPCPPASGLSTIQTSRMRRSSSQ